MARMLCTGIDLYAYATFTAPSPSGIAVEMRRFVDKLQQLDENLPLRTIPLEIQVFTPVGRRLDDTKRAALNNQQIAIEAWQNEIVDRFSSAQRLLATENISNVRLHSRKGG